MKESKLCQFYFLFLLIPLSPLCVAAQLGFNETVDYINGSFSDKKYTLESWNRGYPDNGLGATVSWEHDYSLTTLDGCEVALISGEASSQMNRRRIETTRTFDLSQVTKIESVTEERTARDGSTFYAHTVRFDFGVDVPTNYSEMSKLSKRHKFVSSVSDNSTKTNYDLYVTFRVETNKQASRLSRAFQNLKDTCSSDPFASAPSNSDSDSLTGNKEYSNSNSAKIDMGAPETVATGEYGICLTEKVNNFTANEGCHQYFKKGMQLCADPAGEICTSNSREELCKKIGERVGIAYQYWSSGWGTFNSKYSCMQKCNRDSVINFGGECSDLTLTL